MLASSSHENRKVESFCTLHRHFGRGLGGDRPYLVVDTGGFEPKATSGIMHAMARQTRTAIAEADAIIFLVDGREGLTPQDKIIADLLRRYHLATCGPRPDDPCTPNG